MRRPARRIPGTAGGDGASARQGDDRADAGMVVARAEHAVQLDLRKPARAMAGGNLAGELMPASAAMLPGPAIPLR